MSTGCLLASGHLTQKSAVPILKKDEKIHHNYTDNDIYRVASLLKISQNGKYNFYFIFHNSQEFIGLLI